MEQKDENQQKISPSKNNTNKLIVFLLIAMVILASGIAVFTIYQTNQLKKRITQLKMSPPPSTIVASQSTPPVDNTENWKTYKNEKYNFQMNYPSSWKIGNFKPPLEKVCFDPQAIPPTEKLEKLDILCGLITIHFLENAKTSIIGYEDFKTVTVGNNIEAKLHEKLPDVPRPNPILSNKHELHYYIGKHIKISYYGDAKDTYLKDFNQMLHSFEFINSASSNTIQGASLEEIKYTLPNNWKAEINESQNKKHLLLSPKKDGGFLSIGVYDYQGKGRRTTFCNLTNHCISGVTDFTSTNIGNISGYKATSLDNSGGGKEYFGAKGDKFYIIGTFSPPAPNNFNNQFQNVLDSLEF